MAFKLKTQEPLEKEIQAVILQYLEAKRIWCWKEHSGGIPRESNGVKWMMPIGLTGKADIIGIFKGRFLAIEVKRPSGVISEAQEAFLSRVRQEGGIAILARCLDDVIDAGL